ncbi:MAG: DUF3943 domain-containing protein [Prevotella sp.]|jgi:hypothetical protein|nr:DUF3943 domain-containing protein [Prevotella sp.]
MKDNIDSKQRSKFLFIYLLLFVYVLNIRAQNNTGLQDIEMDTLQLVPFLIVQSFRIDTALSENAYKKNFKQTPSKVNIYDVPYSVAANYPNYRKLALNTGVLYGAGFVALGILQTLPEDATSWNRKEIRDKSPFKRWISNVKKGPTRDKDNAFFNYILHPYGGAAYYMGARSQGFNLFYSFLYSAFISTFFWEYGIEAFMEVPSIQDLIITPTTGVLLGEGFYLLKRHIVANDYKLFGSWFLGSMVAYIIDPVNEVIGIFAGNPNRKKNKSTGSSLSCRPWINPVRNQASYGFALSLSF